MEITEGRLLYWSATLWGDDWSSSSPPSPHVDQGVLVTQS